MKRLTSLIRRDSEFGESIKTLETQFKLSDNLPIVINGLSGGAALAYLVEAVIESRRISGEPSLIICPTDSERDSLVSRLGDVGLNVIGYKSRDLVFHNISASHDIERERLSVLTAILRGAPDAIVTTASAALTHTMPRSLLESLSLSLAEGDEFPPDELAAKLVSLGFCHVDEVDGVGQFARRGGIIDLWHSSDSMPVRIEFFGDEIDRMTCFDAITQRSSGRCKSIELIPATEVVLDADARTRVKKTIEGLLKKCKIEESTRKLAAELATVDTLSTLNTRDKYLDIIYERNENLLSYLEAKRTVFILGTNEVREEYKRAGEYLLSQCSGLIDNFLITERHAGYMDGFDTLEAFLLSHPPVHINSFSGGMSFARLAGLFGFRSRRTVAYGGNFSMLLEDLKTYKKTHYRVMIFSPTRAGADSLIESLTDAGLSATAVYNSPDFDVSSVSEGGIFVDVGETEGFELLMPKLAILSMAEDEGRRVMANRRRQRILRKVGGAGKRIMNYAELTVGDYVVHANYGIGLFEGIETVKVDGVARDYITIKYAGTDKLLVPCDRLELIGKYIGERDDDGNVKLSKMGGDWNRVKSRAKSAVKDIADQLIKLYAERQRTPGFAFPADSELEDEFAAEFDYEETDSQLLAIEEIKADMMKPVPMNRLLCGDVGFGKTEVALRAAFKAILGGKQVAILVPTTILALQHYETTLARMRNYPVTVEMISRFRTPKRQKDILERAKRGQIDILIGTHKLLSKQIEFRDLGLLIIDEEQRFGVAQKEKLKEMAANVDVLTLSATPIPRTLNMAMNGISDMSVLDEAPGERRPVQTYVLEYDDGVIYDAIRRELARGGQVLYLYNRVSDIEYVAARIEKEIPAARIATAHGRMEKNELEDIWQLLVKGEIDVLVCTSIIETGVDLPNANTLIIENADRMGLSQLHQLRGRVGRSERQAYAYFTYRPGKALSEVAAKRLKAIREYAEFGAGFKVALCDLEIRGAGNLLGAEQHGYIESVGYDLYLKLLNEAVLEEKGEKPPEELDTTVDIKTDAYIPETYIVSRAQRIEMYKKISQIECEDDKADVIDELTDRFGDMPRAVERLIDVVHIRTLASRSGISRVSVREGVLYLTAEKPEIEAFGEMFVKYRGMHFTRTATSNIAYKLPLRSDPVMVALNAVKDYYTILEELKNA